MLGRFFCDHLENKLHFCNVCIKQNEDGYFMSVRSPLSVGLTGCSSGEGNPVKDASDAGRSGPEEYFS